MHDYRYRFPDSGWSAAVPFMHFVTAGRITNMLGDPLDEDGEPTAPETAAVFARRGTAARSLAMPGGALVTVPARGDPGFWYVHVRAAIAPEMLPADPITWGFEAVTAEESAAVLGVWA
jgi:hypothetical protein